MVVGDHIMAPRVMKSSYPYSVGNEVPWDEGGEHLEQLTELTFLAAVTDRIRLVPSVMIVPYRNPLLAAKILATLDVLSEGRLTLGVGVGWMEEEFEALDTPPFADRGAVTDEYLEAIKELWTSDNPTYNGRFVKLSNIEFSPKPVQKPHPPIWVGGQSRPAIRRAVEHGNAWHPVGATPATPLEPDKLASDIAYMHSHAERIGRDPSEIGVAMKAPLYDVETTTGTDRRRFSGEPEQIAQDIQTYADLGVSNLIFDVRGSDLSRILERMAWLSEEVMSLV
jgi:probable F420-dependent oxidoreductase